MTLFISQCKELPVANHSGGIRFNCPACRCALHEATALDRFLDHRLSGHHRDFAAFEVGADGKAVTRQCGPKLLPARPPLSVLDVAAERSEGHGACRKPLNGFVRNRRDCGETSVQ